jgi:hypothetical protein
MGVRRTHHGPFGKKKRVNGTGVAGPPSSLPPLPKTPEVCKTPQVEMDAPAVAELMANVAATVSRQVAAVSADVYGVILREIPELRDDQRVLAGEGS